MKQVKRSMQRGFAMLEVLLAVVIIAIVSLAVVELYGKASSSASLDSQERTVNNVISAWQQYASTYYALPTLEILIAENLLPENLSTGTVGQISSPWGMIAVTSTNTDSFQQVSLELTGVPGGVAKQFCSDMFKSYDVMVEGTIVADSDTCGTTAFGTINTFTVGSPKGSLVAVTPVDTVV
jgi:prepilin-type N-terminal cleavage/methylation domain-containing protein